MEEGRLSSKRSQGVKEEERERETVTLLLSKGKEGQKDPSCVFRPS